jgi:uncharacterized protein (UPF0333 family)
MTEKIRTALARKRFPIVLASSLVLGAFVIAPTLVSANVGTAAASSTAASKALSAKAAAQPAADQQAAKKADDQQAAKKAEEKKAPSDNRRTEARKAADAPLIPTFI